MSAQQDASSPFPSGITQPGSQPIVLSHEAIVWIIIVAVIVFVTFGIVVWLLCGSCRTRRRRRGHNRTNSKALYDDRNNYHEWNRSAPLPMPPTGESPQEMNSNVSAISMTPLKRAAVKPAGAEVHPGEPVVVDQQEQPAYASRRGTRYYSEVKESAWKRFSRFSQIGRAM